MNDGSKSSESSTFITTVVVAVIRSDTFLARSYETKQKKTIFLMIFDFL